MLQYETLLGAVVPRLSQKSKFISDRGTYFSRSSRPDCRGGPVRLSQKCYSDAKHTGLRAGHRGVFWRLLGLSTRIAPHCTPSASMFDARPAFVAVLLKLPPDVAWHPASSCRVFSNLWSCRATTIESSRSPAPERSTCGRPGSP